MTVAVTVAVTVSVTVAVTVAVTRCANSTLLLLLDSQPTNQPTSSYKNDATTASESLLAFFNLHSKVGFLSSLTAVYAKNRSIRRSV